MHNPASLDLICTFWRYGLKFMIANVSLLRVIILYTHTVQSEASEITNVCGVYISVVQCSLWWWYRRIGYIL